MNEIKSDLLALGPREVLVGCRNSQGLEVRATPVRLDRFSVVFEVYNPHSILQLSEVLSEFRISIGERLVYAGRAVVSNLVNTGIMLLCQATLENDWLDIDLFSPVSQQDRLQEELVAFLKESAKIDAIPGPFKVAVADLQSLLADLRRWLEQIELGLRSIPAGDQSGYERDVIQQVRQPLMSAIDDRFGRFELIATEVGTEVQGMLRNYLRRQVHPLVLCAPFPYRTFHKPLGYAGDYEMVNMLLRDPIEGASLFAKIVNLWFLSQPPALAHRNRITYLVEQIVGETNRIAARNRRIRILNLGCGPAVEIQRFLADHPASDQADFLLLDFNEETIGFTRKRLDDLKRRHHRDTEFQIAKKSVHQILKESACSNPATPKFDLVYCAGLFDYLSDRICQRLMNILYDQLAPGGLLISTNVDPSNPLRNGMEYLLEWHLNYRNQAQMTMLHPTASAPSDIATKSDETGVNIYLEVRKPGA